MLFVLTGILRPFTSIKESSTASGPDLRGLAREDVIFPNALVPAFNTTFPLTETSCAIFASKLLPTTVCELMRLTVLTVRIVPVGIVAAKEAGAAAMTLLTQSDHTSLVIILGVISSFRFIFASSVSSFMLVTYDAP
jgi:hypothetical protein